MTYHRNQQNVAIANVSRRGLLKGAAGTAAFVLAAQLPAVRAAHAYATGAGAMAHGVVTNPHIFVSIDKDGTVSIVAHRAEMGTGAARTTLPLIVADELEADWSRVRIVQSPGDEERARRGSRGEDPRGGAQADGTQVRLRRTRRRRGGAAGARRR
jgi:isoquinoline 1-oxidoreductase beta subunit